jgi:Zn-dependent peptidase ImmA (M78 family)
LPVTGGFTTTSEKQIPLSVGSYGNAFVGLLEYVAGRFFVHCNLDRENSPEFPRGRFTLSHELGHFFIDEHRNSLASGKVKPHGSSIDKRISNLEIEREANLFASYLLMPASRFARSVKRLPVGLAALEQVAKEFDVSLTCAAIRFVTQEVFPCAIIKWSDGGYAWKWCSRSFWEIAIPEKH